MGGMDEMGNFYDHCLETLYPPGMCGMLCNQHTYDCRLAEVNEACCTEARNCNSDGIPTHDCPVGCALVFPIFVIDCRDHAIAQGLAPGLLDTMETTCEQLDGGALVEYAHDLIAQGCVLDIDMGGHHRRQLAKEAAEAEERRQLQIASQWLDSTDPRCTWDDMNNRAHEVDQICCATASCNGGIPTDCNPMCAIIFHQFTQDCGNAITSILGSDGRVAQLVGFDHTCTDSLDTDAFMLAIANADCGDDVLGRAEVCDGASDLDITFIGDETDSSGNTRGIRKHGDTVLMPTGVHFDGDGDYFTIHTWDYAQDSTFSISVWIVKEDCTAGLYEYLYSHQTDDQVGTDQIAEGGVTQAFAMFYIGCEGQGSVTSTLDGSIMRYWAQDDVGTAVVFDYPLHDAGAFDSITNTWLSIAYAQTPGCVKAYSDGMPIPIFQLGFPATQPNAGNPDPQHLTSSFTTMSLASDLYVGGRADRAGDRHFRGTMAMLMVSNAALTDAQVSCYFTANEATLAALPPVVPPANTGPMSCPMAVAAIMSPGQLAICLPAGGGPSCTGRCGSFFTQIASSCANEPPPTVDCSASQCDQRQASAYNAAALKTMCTALPPGCETSSMMPIIQQCSLPNPQGGNVDRGWQPPCPCDTSTIAPLIACADSFGASMGMTTSYMQQIQTGVGMGCTGGVTTLITIPTDGTAMEGLVTDADGVLFQFHADAGQTYLLDTEVGTLLDTVMDLIDVDQQTTIAENDDDERASGQLDSYIEWTCPSTGTYFINVFGFGGDTGTISLTVNVATGTNGGGDPCTSVADMNQQSADISFQPRGGTLDNQACAWRINCRRGVVTVSFSRFSTEANFDFVTLFDGRDEQATQLVHLSGSMTGLPQTTYTSSGPMLLLHFDSDASIGAEGFEASYMCGTAAPPPAPPGPIFTAITVGAPMIRGEVYDRGGTWYSFDATRGMTYQMETDATSLSDTMMQLVDTDQQTTLAENDDDTRRSGMLDSFIEWTCEATGTYYINVKGFGGAIGTFTIGVTPAGGGGGDPCVGGVALTAPAATVSYTPAGGTLDSTTCDWTITCAAGESVDVSFTRFATESYFDTVNVYDGGQGGNNLGSLSGDLADLPKRDFLAGSGSVLIEFISDASIGADGFELVYACAGGVGGHTGLSSNYVSAVATVYSGGAGPSGMDTYRLTASPTGSASNIYTIFGQDGAPMEVPAAYQVVTPFGANTGGTSPAFWAVANNVALGFAEYDSWLTVGITDGANSGALSSIGFDWTAWSAARGYSCNDCAIFWMSPDSAPTGDIVVAQITVAAGSTGVVTLGLQGRSRGGAEDWQAHAVSVHYP